MKKYAIVFPGQGSQSIGMLAELGKAYPVIKTTFAQASDVLGYDLWSLIQQGTAEELNKTWITQPALLVASVAIYRLWQQNIDLNPVMVAGHSLGEYSALTCAGVLNFSDAVRLVEIRGKLMQQAVPAGVGAMYAIIGLDDEHVKEACISAAKGEIVSAVNFNSPGQVVIAGDKGAVERAADLCKAKGAKRTLPLSVSVPSHCELMQPAAERLAIELNNISLNFPAFDIVNNTDAKIETDIELIKHALVKQLYRSVLWTDSIKYMVHKNIDTFIEMGPGKVLTGLIKRIEPTASALAINDNNSLSVALDVIQS